MPQGTGYPPMTPPGGAKMGKPMKKGKNTGQKRMMMKRSRIMAPQKHGPMSGLGKIKA